MQIAARPAQQLHRVNANFVETIQKFMNAINVIENEFAALSIVLLTIHTFHPVTDLTDMTGSGLLPLLCCCY